MELELLPSDIWSSIFLSCPPSTLYQIIQVSHTFCGIINTEKFWYDKFHLSFDEPDLQVQSWREAYRNYGVIEITGWLVYNHGINSIQNLEYLTEKHQATLPIRANRLALTRRYLLAVDLHDQLHILGGNRNNVLGLTAAGSPDYPWVTHLHIVDERDPTGSKYAIMNKLSQNKHITAPIKAVAGAEDISLILTVDGDVMLNNYNSCRLLVQPTPNFKAKQAYACYNGGFIIIDEDNYVWIMYSSFYLFLNSGIQIGHGQAMEKTSFQVKQYAVPTIGNQNLVIDLDDNLCIHTWKIAGDLHSVKWSFRRLKYKAKQVACTNRYSVFISLEDRLFVFGDNEYGRLGLNSTQEVVRVFTQVPDLLVKQVVCCATYMLVLDLDGQVWGSGQATHLNLMSRNFTKLLPEKALRIFASDCATGLLLHPSPK